MLLELGSRAFNSTGPCQPEADRRITVEARHCTLNDPPVELYSKGYLSHRSCDVLPERDGRSYAAETVHELDYEEEDETNRPLYGKLHP